MPRPRPVPPPSADHQQHDVLLVSQFAAGDPLDPDRQREAQALVSSCGACTSLAADLRAISAAVAWEPVPPRRRDFRIDAPTAERLRGSPLTRFLRRLSLPQAKALSPAAVGVMSIGLLFVVAGTVWPAADLGLSGAPAVVVPADEAPLAREPFVDSSAATMEAQLGDSAAGQPDAATEPEAFVDTDGLADEAAALEMRAEDVAGKAAVPDDGDAEKAVRAAAAAAEAEQDAGAFALDAVEEAPGQGAESEAAPAPESEALAPAAADDVSVADDAASVTAAAEEMAIGSILLVVGAVLAVGGAVLFLLALLARRTADPLLR